MKSQIVKHVFMPLLFFAAISATCSCKPQESIQSQSCASSQRSASSRSLHTEVCRDSLMSRFELEFDSLEIDVAPIAGSYDAPTHDPWTGGTYASMPACAPVRVKMVNGRLKRHESSSRQTTGAIVRNASMSRCDSIVSTKEKHTEPARPANRNPGWVGVLPLIVIIAAAAIGLWRLRRKG